ncbi:HAD domain-containing protein [Nannocystaceae bacterium ST9]
MPPVVLFLDFDGVLNGERFLRQQRNHSSPSGQRLFDPANLAALDQLCLRAPVNRIVVTSTWRIGRSVVALRKLLADEGFERAGRIADVTPDLGAGLRSRAIEIRTWIAAQGPVRAVILDDVELGIGEGFFRIDASEGLTLARVDEVLAWLG